MRVGANGIIHVITIITIISGGWRGEWVRGLKTIKTASPFSNPPDSIHPLKELRVGDRTLVKNFIKNLLQRGGREKGAGIIMEVWS